MKNWYVVYTQPCHERVAQENLERQRFEVFCPLYRRRRSHARRVEMVPAALFPRYLFVAFNAADPRWRAIRSTRGVVDLVRSGLHPTPVPDAVVETIRAHEDESGYVVLTRHIALVRGDRIRIDSGPFADYEAIFEAQRDEDRVIALLALMGRQVFVEVSARAVMPCMDGPRRPAPMEGKNGRLKAAMARAAR